MKRKPTPLNALAIQYMAEVMDLHEPTTKQYDNQMLRHLVQFAERMQVLTAAYLTDRADQYDTKSPCWVALTDEAANVINGEVAAADQNGDLDAELVARVTKWRRHDPRRR